MKTRILVWTIVGILTVAVIILLVASPKRTTRVTLEQLQRGATRSANELNKLLTELAAAKTSPLAAAHAELLRQTEADLTQARQLIEKVATATNPREAQADLVKANKLLSRARRALRTAQRPPKPAKASALSDTSDAPKRLKPAIAESRILRQA